MSLFKKILIIIEIIIVLILLSVSAFYVTDTHTQSTVNDTNNLTTTISDGEILIPTSDLPAFAQQVYNQPDNWSSMNFNGLVISKPQALSILSTAVSENSSDDIRVGVILQADKSYGEVDTGNITMSEYYDMSNRVSQGIIDKGDKCPEYVGIRVKGQPDISYDKMTKLFALVIIKNYPDKINLNQL